MILSRQDTANLSAQTLLQAHKRLLGLLCFPQPEYWWGEGSHTTCPKKPQTDSVWVTPFLGTLQLLLGLLRGSSNPTTLLHPIALSPCTWFTLAFLVISAQANETSGTESNRAQVCLLSLNVHYRKDTTLTSRNCLYHILFGQTTLTGSHSIPGRTFEEGFGENRWSLRGDTIIWKEDREFFEPAMW